MHILYLQRFLIILFSFILIAIQSSSADRVFKYPRIQQEKSEWCWNACSQWILGFHGTQLTQTEIAQYGFVDGVTHNEWNWIYTSSERGTFITDTIYGRGINIILEHWGVATNVQNGKIHCILTESEFKEEIDSGHPFVVRYDWGNNSGHFVVAIGYQNYLCWMMNPWINDGIQIFNYEWVEENMNGPLRHHKWDFTLQTAKVDTVPELTTTFPSDVAIGSTVSATLTSTLNGRDVTNSTFFTVLTDGVTIDPQSRIISWTQTAQGPTSVSFIREFGNAIDTITREVITTSVINLNTYHPNF